MARNLRHFYKISCQLPALQTTNILTKTRIQQYSKFTSGTNLTTMTDENAYELVLNLDDSERNRLKLALNKLESNNIKQQLEGN